MTAQRPDSAARTGPVPTADFARDHALALVRFAYLLVGDRHRAEDLVQDVLLTLYRRFGDRIEVENPNAYARKAIVHASVDWRRRRSSTEVMVDAVSDSATLDPDPAERDALWAALRTLPVRQRTVLVLRFYQDATDDDIAELLGCRPGTVRSLASRALAALRDDQTLKGDQS